MSDKNKLIVFLDDQIERSGKFCKSEWIPFFMEIKKIVEESEEESLCDDCEWFDNPGACPDYDESKCRYNAPMEKEE